MSPPSRWASVAAVAIGVGALTLAVIKARDTSITHDEAVTYVLYVSGPWTGLFENYTAGNHVLFSALARISTAAFGANELTFRLPALAASAVFVVMLWKVLRFATKGWLATLGMAAVLLNPMHLDYLAMARGYSISLAAFLIALHVALRGFVKGVDRGRIWGIGASLGIAVAGNLTALLPAAGFGAALSILLATSRPETPRRPSLVAIVVALVVPSVLAIVLHLAAMGWHVGRHHYWYGTTTLVRMLVSFDQRALFHEAPVPLVPFDEVARQDLLSTVMSAIVSPALLLSLIASACVAAIGARRRNRPPPAPGTHLLILSGASLLCTLGVLAAAHAGLGVLYPRGRTGICLTVLTTIGVVAMIVESRESRGRALRAGGVAATVLLIALVARYLTQIRLDRFGENYLEAHARQDFDVLEAQKPAAPRPPFRVLAQPSVYGPAAEFYRLTRAVTWMDRVDREIEPGVVYDAVLTDAPTAAADVAREHFREIARDADTGSVILVRR